MKVIVFIVSAFWIAMPLWAQQQVVADPPEVRGPFTLVATYDSATGHNAFGYNGNTVPPVIRVMPGSVDLAILGTLWLLVVVALSAPARVSVPAALTVYAVHSALLIRAEGVNPLALSELEAAAYICAAFLIAAAVLRPTIAVHLSLAARRASLASRSAADSTRARLRGVSQKAAPRTASQTAITAAG